MALNPDQFKTYYRGLGVPDLSSIDHSKLGNHWSEDYTTARQFAQTSIMGESGEQNKFGVVLHAKIHPRHIVQPGSDHPDAIPAFISRIYRGELESTVGTGSRVHLDTMDVFPVKEHPTGDNLARRLDYENSERGKPQQRTGRA
jgi:hypothetical protein